MALTVGTKSFLYGAHQFIIHPFMVAAAWRKLYGTPWHPMLWICFFLHDVGYIGKPNIDGPAGSLHPAAGAKVAGWLGGEKWYAFCAGHSRTFARIAGVPVSRLCAADKLAMILEPKWLYMARAKATGEVLEYVKKHLCTTYPELYRGGRFYLYFSGRYICVRNRKDSSTILFMKYSASHLLASWYRYATQHSKEWLIKHLAETKTEIPMEVKAHDR